FGCGELRPQQQRLEPAEREESDTHADVQDADLLVVDRSEPPRSFGGGTADPERDRGHLKPPRYVASASRSASESGTLGMSDPGLYRCGSASHARMCARSFGSTPAPIEARDATCVRSGPAVPAAAVPRIVWQFTQMFDRKTRSPSPPGEATGKFCSASQLSNSACD